MIWPTFCIDDFFINPEAIINYSKKLKFYKSEGNYPGERTDSLHKVDYDFFLNTTRKIIVSLYPNEIDNLNWTATQYFQKIKTKDFPNQGFIHQDLEKEFTSIVYLTDDLSSGTCIYKRIKEPIPEISSIRKKGYLDLKKQKTKKFKDELKFHNSHFKKTIEFKSIKNRMIIFDGSADHGVENFGKNSEERLTLITFFSAIYRKDGQSLKFHSNECKKY